MAFLKLNFYVCIMIVMCTIEFVENNRIQKLETLSNILKESLSNLQFKVYSNEVEIGKEMERIWTLLNTSMLNEGVEKTSVDIAIDTLRKLEGRSQIITKGFADEKTNLRGRVADFEHKIVDLKNQYINSLLNIENTKDDMKSLGEQFISFKEVLNQNTESSILSINQSIQKMATDHTDLMNSGISSANQMFSEIRQNIDSELNQLKGKQEQTDNRIKDLETMVKNVGRYFKATLYCSLKGAIFENACYLLFKSKKTWQDAVEECSKLGAHLAEPNSQSENQFLADTYKDIENIWLGGSDLNQEGMWVWQSNNESFDFENWFTSGGEPNNHNGKEHCLELYPAYRKDAWNDNVCSASFMSVCEFSIDLFE